MAMDWQIARTTNVDNAVGRFSSTAPVVASNGVMRFFDAWTHADGDGLSDGVEAA